MTCSVEGCDRAILARSLCRMHYQRQHKHGEVGPAGPLADEPPKGCSVEGCDRDHMALGLCVGHYTRQRMHGDVRASAPIQPWRVDDPCSVPECGRKHFARGLCQAHSARARRGDLHADVPINPANLLGWTPAEMAERAERGQAAREVERSRPWSDARRTAYENQLATPTLGANDMKYPCMSAKYMPLLRKARAALILRENRYVGAFETVAAMVAAFGAEANFDLLSTEVPTEREEINTHNLTGVACPHPSYLALRVLTDRLSATHDRIVALPEVLEAMVRLTAAQPELL